MAEPHVGIFDGGFDSWVVDFTLNLGVIAEGDICLEIFLWINQLFVFFFLLCRTSVCLLCFNIFV